MKKLKEYLKHIDSNLDLQDIFLFTGIVSAIASFSKDVNWIESWAVLFVGICILQSIRLAFKKFIR